jgi:hypothetical protein
MEDGRIQNSQITASSYYDSRSQPWLARLNQAASIQNLIKALGRQAVQLLVNTYRLTLVQHPQ